MQLRVVLAQSDAVLGDVQSNADRAQAFIAAARLRADLIVFPELSLCGYSLTDVPGAAVRLDGPELRAIAETTRGGPAVAVGFVEESDDFVWFNSAAVFADGDLLHLHRKIYPPTYGQFEEGKHFGRGGHFGCFDLKGWRVGLMICADWWHPSLPYLAAADGAHLLIAMAASPQGGLGSKYDSSEGWYRLNRTYASVYGAYVLFCNRTGTEGAVSFWGGSEAVSPYGETMARAGVGEELVEAWLDGGQVRAVRHLLPTMRDEDLAFTAASLARIAERKAAAGAENSERRGGFGPEPPKPKRRSSWRRPA